MSSLVDLNTSVVLVVIIVCFRPKTKRSIENAQLIIRNSKGPMFSSLCFFPNRVPFVAFNNIDSNEKIIMPLFVVCLMLIVVQQLHYGRHYHHQTFLRRTVRLLFMTLIFSRYGLVVCSSTTTSVLVCTCRYQIRH